MFMAECDGCKTKGFTEDGTAFGAAVSCGCCPEDHDHDANAEGGTPCRPITVYALPGTAQMTGVLGGN